MLSIRQASFVTGRMKFLVELLILSLWAVENRCTIVETGRWPPVHISLFYESLCPDCRAFMVNELCPTWARMKEVLNITLIPFGNAEVIQDAQERQFRCQHGEAECRGNRIQLTLVTVLNPNSLLWGHDTLILSLNIVRLLFKVQMPFSEAMLAFNCVIYYLKNTSSYLPVICCMESAFIEMQQCLQERAPTVTWENITDCADEELGSQLMYQSAQRTNELEPPHDYVPWILINGEHSEDMQHHAETGLLDLVCKTYTGPPPVVCDQSAST